MAPDPGDGDHVSLHSPLHDERRTARGGLRGHGARDMAHPEQRLTDHPWPEGGGWVVRLGQPRASHRDSDG